MGRCRPAARGRRTRRRRHRRAVGRGPSMGDVMMPPGRSRRQEVGSHQQSTERSPGHGTRSSASQSSKGSRVRSMVRQTGSSGSSSAGGRTYCRPGWSPRSGRSCSLRRPWSASGTGCRRPPRSRLGRSRRSRAWRRERGVHSTGRGRSRSPAQSRYRSRPGAMVFSASACPTSPQSVRRRPVNGRREPTPANEETPVQSPGGSSAAGQDRAADVPLQRLTSSQEECPARLLAGRAQVYVRVESLCRGALRCW